MAKNTFRDDEDLKTTMNTKIISRLLSYLKPYKLQVLWTILCMAVVVVSSLLNPYFMKIAIDQNIMNKNIKGLIIIGGAMLLLNGMSMICSRYRITIMSRVTNDILLTIRQELYNHIQKLTFSFFDSRPVGKILARVIGDVNSLQDLFTNSITTLIPESATLICVAVIMLSMNYKLALISFCILPFMVVSMFYIQTVSRKRWQIFRKKTSNMNAYIHEDFSGIRVIQGYAVEEKTSSTFAGLVENQMGAFVKAVKLNDMFWPMVEISWGAGMVLVYWYSVRLINTGSISVGLLVAMTSYASMFWRPIMNISNFYNTLVTNLAAAERIFEIMDIEPDIKNVEGSITIPKINGEVEFKNVTFSYEDGSPVLDDVSFKVNQGETIALVGPTGAGKTTIVNLISRFYDTQEGGVFIDGRNVRDYDLEWLRSQMAVMMQDTFLFSATIKENIRYGKLDATDEEVIRAAKAVNAHDFIMRLENGYDTEVNERGSRLSVGQRQLISFARAILANPRILILDEATASIDTQTERLVQQGIQRLLKGRTSFVIAHRLSTIRDADRIMIIDGGRIVEEGNHESLLRCRGLYYDLYTAQYKFLNQGA
jgi:ABC-type multidrug transport system, ATPase and permease components